MKLGAQQRANEPMIEDAHGAAGGPNQRGCGVNPFEKSGAMIAPDPLWEDAAGSVGWEEEGEGDTTGGEGAWNPHRSNPFELAAGTGSQAAASAVAAVDMAGHLCSVPGSRHEGVKSGESEGHENQELARPLIDGSVIRGGEDAHGKLQIAQDDDGAFASLLEVEVEMVFDMSFDEIHGKEEQFKKLVASDVAQVCGCCGCGYCYCYCCRCRRRRCCCRREGY